MSRLLLASVFVVLAAGCAATPADDSSAQSSNVEASQPLSFRGEFVPSGVVEPSMRLTIDVVDTRMSDAQERLTAIRAGGGLCELVVSNTYRCRTHKKANAVPQTSLDKIAAKNATASVTFGEMHGVPSKTSEGESLVEWSIPQNGSSPAGAFEEYRYLQLDGGLTKIVFPGASEPYELIVKDAGHLKKWDRVVVNEGRWRWHEDMALVVLAAPQE